ncbi:MAG: PrsW family intramembrane metalloprotease [Ruminococcaceae bacterium]|nr:PrsW family intramembrane metalloprotease [Oscillospiraceae bacterium]
MKYCTKCGTQLTDEAIFCASCGTKCEAGPAISSEHASDNNTKEDNIMDSITGGINKLAGGEGAVHPPLGKIFGSVFKKHNKSESEEIFICGTEKTTPALSELDSAWPKPWLFSRILLAFAIALFIMYICCTEFENIKMIPGLIFIGSFMVPIAALIFFFELNVPKNISFFTIIKIFLIGGCASLLCSLFLYSVIDMGESDYWGAVLIGVIEEVAKLAIVTFFLSRERGTDHAINGLLIGAAVGAGFAAFESAGYAFEWLLMYGFDDMFEVILLRGFLAPGGHVVWAAISGYAIMLAKGKEKLSLSFLNKTAFWKLFWIPVLLHAIWDMPIEFGSEYCLVQILLTITSWVVIFVLIGGSLTSFGKAAKEAGNISAETQDEQ